MKLTLTVALAFVAACSAPQNESGVPLAAPRDTALAEAAGEVLAHPGLLADIDRALRDLGFEPAPADAAQALSDLVTTAEPDTSRHYDLASSVTRLVEAGVVPELCAALESLGPEPAPRAAARAIETVIRSR